MNEYNIFTGELLASPIPVHSNANSPQGEYRLVAYGKQWDPREGDGVAVELRIVGTGTGAFVEVRTADGGIVAQIDAGDYRKPEDILHALVKTLRNLEESD